MVSDKRFGRLWRQVREEKGMTMEQAEEETKIRKFYLRALEEDNFSVMPAQVYAIGFVRKYCVFLGIDEQEMIHRYKQLSGGIRKEEDSAATPVATYEDKPPFISRVSTRNMAAAIIFLVIALWLGSYAADYLANQGSRTKTPVVKPPVTDNQKPTEPEEKPPAVVNPNEVRVVLTGTDVCWYQVQVDSGAAEQGMLQNGQTKEYVGKEKITVKLGNAGGAKVAVNGQEPTYLGANGEVISQEYTVNQ